MTITEINFRMADKNEAMLIAFASCVIDDKLYLNNIAIRKKHDGSIYLNFPKYKSPKGNEYPYFKPITSDMYEKMKKEFLNVLKTEEAS